MRGLAVFTLLATLVLINASPFTVRPEDTTTTEGGSGNWFEACFDDCVETTSDEDYCWNKCMGFGSEDSTTPEDTTTPDDTTTPEDTTIPDDTTTPEDTRTPEDTTTTTPEPATSTLREYEILWQ